MPSSASRSRWPPPQAIWGRLEAIGATERRGSRAPIDEALRACGLSRQKIAYGRGLAESGVDFVALRAMPDATRWWPNWCG